VGHGFFALLINQKPKHHVNHPHAAQRTGAGSTDHLQISGDRTRRQIRLETS
jgi:hypothetical protein